MLSASQVARLTPSQWPRQAAKQVKWVAFKADSTVDFIRHTCVAEHLDIWHAILQRQQVRRDSRSVQASRMRRAPM